ncbi:MAG TPA: hypothetical protein VGW75_18835 [Solirubrobacteraceae bacterium]|jgi:hypothetical protein|nr:hypothetical protein [Solirubrobacteraceae bacterium]
MPSRPFDPTLHGVLDYSTGALLQVLPKALDLEGTTAGRIMRGSGAAHAGYSLFTDYELGAVKVIPFPVHLAIDAAGAVALGAAPFVTGAWKKGTRHWLPHVLLGLYELSSVAMTEPGDTNHPERPKAGVKRPVAEAPPAFPAGHPAGERRFVRTNGAAASGA